jgi:hypothetical protein
LSLCADPAIQLAEQLLSVHQEAETVSLALAAQQQAPADALEDDAVGCTCVLFL